MRYPCRAGARLGYDGGEGPASATSDVSGTLGYLRVLVPGAAIAGADGGSRMSSQQLDLVAYEGDSYELVGVRGVGLFDPAAHGIQTVAPHTGCWRGFIARYEVRAHRLHLRSLSIWSERPMPPLFGVERTGASTDDGAARPPSDLDPGGRIEGEYAFDEAPVAFTGGLLLGREFVGQGYRTMGSDPPWLYATVHDLTFEDGWLVDSIDRSAEMASARARAARIGEEVALARPEGATHRVVLDRATRGRRPAPPTRWKGKGRGRKG